LRLSKNVLHLPTDSKRKGHAMSTFFCKYTVGSSKEKSLALDFAREKDFTDFLKEFFKDNGGKLVLGSIGFSEDGTLPDALVAAEKTCVLDEERNATRH
jgi:hypothetical protein